jgi:hypothetical protein
LTPPTDELELLPPPTAEQAKDQAKQKGKGKGDPLDAAVADACAQLLECGAEGPSAALLARLVKIKVLQTREAELAARAEAEAARIAAAEVAAAEAAAGSGAPPSRGKSAKGKGKGKGAAVGVGKGKKVSKMTPRSKEQPTTVDDEPDDGPDAYFYIQGIEDPAFIKELDECGAPAAIIISAFAKADADKAAADKAATAAGDATTQSVAATTATTNAAAATATGGNGTAAVPDVRPFKERVLADVESSPNTSHMRHIAWLPLEVGTKGAIEPDEVFDRVAALSFDVVAQHVEYAAYKASLALCEIPTCPAVADIVMDHYDAALAEIPDDCVSVAVLLDCMLEHVELTVAADDVRQAEAAAAAAAAAAATAAAAEATAEPEKESRKEKHSSKGEREEARQPLLDEGGSADDPDTAVSRLVDASLELPPGDVAGTPAAVPGAAAATDAVGGSDDGGQVSPRAEASSRESAAMGARDEVPAAPATATKITGRGAVAPTEANGVAPVAHGSSAGGRTRLAAGASGPTVARYGDEAAIRAAGLKRAPTVTPLERERRVLAASVGAVLASFAKQNEPAPERERAMLVQRLRHFTDLPDEVVDSGLWQLQLETMLHKAVGGEEGGSPRPNLSDWTVQEGLHKETLQQVLSKAVTEGELDVVTEYDPLRNVKLAVLLNPHTGPYRSDATWAASLATTAGFTKYVEHIAPTLARAASDPTPAAQSRVGYSIGDLLINISGHEAATHPICGGKVSVRKQHFLKGASFASRRIAKDDNVLTLHLQADGTPDAFVVSDRVFCTSRPPQFPPCFCLFVCLFVCPVAASCCGAAAIVGLPSLPAAGGPAARVRVLKVARAWWRVHGCVGWDWQTDPTLTGLMGKPNTPLRPTWPTARWSASAKEHLRAPATARRPASPGTRQSPSPSPRPSVGRTLTGRRTGTRRRARRKGEASPSPSPSLSLRWRWRWKRLSPSPSPNRRLTRSFGWMCPRWTGCASACCRTVVCRWPLLTRPPSPLPLPPVVVAEAPGARTRRAGTRS